MSGIYTQGIWTVKPGRADDFVAAWTEFAEWTSANAPGAGKGQLLRDAGNPDRFVSFGPWDSAEAVAAWRAMEGWGARVGRIREMLVSFEAANLELVVERGG